MGSSFDRSIQQYKPAGALIHSQQLDNFPALIDNLNFIEAAVILDIADFEVGI
jgi:hypothetical protein